MSVALRKLCYIVAESIVAPGAPDFTWLSRTSALQI